MRTPLLALLAVLFFMPAAGAVIDFITDLEATSVREGQDTTITAECLPSTSTDNLVVDVYDIRFLDVLDDDVLICDNLSVQCNDVTAPIGATCTINDYGRFYAIAEGGGQRATTYFTSHRVITSASQIPDAHPLLALAVLAGALFVFQRSKSKH